MGIREGVVRTLGHPGKVLALAVGIGGLVLGASGVFASLAAQSSATQSVSTSTLKVSLASGTGSSGFTTNVNIGPGQTVNRLVTLTNTGALTGSNLVMRITTDGGTFSNALTIAVVKCTATGYPCSSAGTVLSTTTASTLTGASTQSVDTSFTPGETVFLQVTFALPSLPAVTTVNGVLTGYQTGGSNISFQFEMTQEPGTTTNS